MRTFFQSEKTPRRAAGLRLLALLCALIVSVMSTAQVSHHHQAAPLKQSSNRNAPHPGDRCPLCMALHSALPVSIHVPAPVLRAQALDTVAANTERAFQWRFEMASRAPPAAAHCA